MLNKLIYKKVVLTKGVGRHKEKLQSFEMALRSANIARFNLVRVSSIFPSGALLVSNSSLLDQESGQIIFCVMSDNATNEANRLVASSVGIAIPQDKNKYGYISEHHSFGQTAQQVGEYAEDLAAEMLATTLGISFDSDKNWNERKEIWKISGDIVKTDNITQSAIGRNGIWTTVVAAAVFIL